MYKCTKSITISGLRFEKNGTYASITQVDPERILLYNDSRNHISFEKYELEICYGGNFKEI